MGGNIDNSKILREKVRKNVVGQEKKVRFKSKKKVNTLSTKKLSKIKGKETTLSTMKKASFKFRIIKTQYLINTHYVDCKSLPVVGECWSVEVSPVQPVQTVAHSGILLY